MTSAITREAASPRTDVAVTNSPTQNLPDISDAAGHACKQQRLHNDDGCNAEREPQQVRQSQHFEAEASIFWPFGPRDQGGGGIPLLSSWDRGEKNSAVAPGDVPKQSAGLRRPLKGIGSKLVA
jgi:hypothetical protein